MLIFGKKCSTPLRVQNGKHTSGLLEIKFGIPSNKLVFGDMGNCQWLLQLFLNLDF